MMRRAAEAMDFYKRAFNATELFRLVAPSGEIGHAEIKIGDSPLMLADPYDEGGFRSPEALGGSSVGLHVYVEDVDALFAQGWPPVRRPSGRFRINFTVTARVRFRIHLGIFGFWPPTRKISRRRRSTNELRRG